MVVLKGRRNKRLDELLRALRKFEEDQFLKLKSAELGMRRSTAEQSMLDRHIRGLRIPAEEVVSYCSLPNQFTIMSNLRC